MAAIDLLLPWQQILHSLKMGRACFTARSAEQWPVGALERLEQEGILVPAGHAEWVVCNECSEGCVLRPDLALEQQHYEAWCERGEFGLIRISERDMRRWLVSMEGIAGWLARQVGGRGEPRHLAPGVWELSDAGASVRLLLALGFHDGPDSEALATVLTRQSGVRTEVLVAVASEIPAWVPSITRVQLLLDVLDSSSDDVRVVGLGRKPERGRKTDLLPVAVPAGTPWHAITIRIVDVTSVQIAVGEQVHSRTYQELGMSDLRKHGAPAESWFLLLAFARGHGRLEARSIRGTGAGALRAAGKMKVSLLRRLLETAIPAQGKCIQDYRRGEGWVTAFNLVLVEH